MIYLRFVSIKFVFLLPSQNFLFFLHTLKPVSVKLWLELVNRWIVMKFEQEVWNLFPHIPTVEIFVVEEMTLALSFLFSHIHPNLSQ